MQVVGGRRPHCYLLHTNNEGRAVVRQHRRLHCTFRMCISSNRTRLSRTKVWVKTKNSRHGLQESYTRGMLERTHAHTHTYLHMHIWSHCSALFLRSDHAVYRYGRCRHMLSHGLVPSPIPLHAYALLASFDAVDSRQ